MIALMYVTLLFVNVRTILGYSTTNDCGTLTLEEPAVKGRNVTFTFVPKTQSGGAIILWLRYTPATEWESVTRASSRTTFQTDSVYYLLLSNSTETDNTDYKVRYFLGFPFQYCETTSIHINFTVLTECGIVYQRTQRVIAGADVELRYIPSMDVINHPDDYFRYWLFTPDSCSNVTACTHVNISGLFNETETERNEFVLMIPNMNENMNGVYRIECTTERNPNKRTNGVRLYIPVNQEPNRTLMFANTRDFGDCEGCVYGTAGNMINITCKTGIGPKPLNVYISIEQTRLNIYLVDGGTYTAIWRVNEKDNMKKVKCEVDDKDMTTRLRVSTLYVMQRPQKPDLYMDKLKDDQPINVSCTSKGGRPAGNVSMHISGIAAASYPVIQKSTHDSSGTFTSITVLTAMQREWNGKKIICCVSHETLEKMICSKEEKISYKLPSTSVATKSQPSTNEYRPNHILTVTCVITNANSTCQAAWNIRDISGLNVMLHTHTSHDNGRTTTHVATLNVLNDTSGKTSECRVSCTEFDVNKSDIYHLVPYGRVIYIHLPTTYNTEGTTVGLQCTVKSYPVSTINWMKRSLTTSLAEKTCGNNMCLDISEYSGVYTCLTNESNEHDIQIHVIEQQHTDSGSYDNDVVDNDVVDNDVDDKEDEDNEDNKHVSGTQTSSGNNHNPIIWPIVGASGVVVVFIIIGLVIKLMVRRKTEDNRETITIPTSEAQGCPVYATVLPKSQRLTNGNGASAEPACQHGIGMFDENDASDGSTYEHDETTFAVNNDSYACDNPVSLRQSVLAYKQEKSNGLSKELIYADLDIQPSGSSIRPRADSPTEYVSIDFTKAVFTVGRDSRT